MSDFEPIYSALWTRLSGIAGLKTKTRRLLHWADVPTSQRPALFMAQASQIPTQQRGLPVIWQCNVDVYLYINTPSPEIPAIELNEYLGKIRAALAPDSLNDNVCTLGGLVHNCYISGPIETDEGTLGDESVAVVPITFITV